MSIGAGIAVAGIWLGVGLCAWGGVEDSILMVALLALFATLAVAKAGMQPITQPETGTKNGH